MARFAFALVAACGGLFVAAQAIVTAGDDAKSALQGVWVGRSMEIDGKMLPADEAKKMQFTFKGDKLFIKGNLPDGREDECDYKIDPKQSPAHLDFTPRNEKKSLQGIYEIKDGVLKVCIRHETGSGGRPKEFATKAGSQLILVVFDKKKS